MLILHSLKYKLRTSTQDVNQASSLSLFSSPQALTVPLDSQTSSGVWPNTPPVRLRRQTPACKPPTLTQTVCSLFHSPPILEIAWRRHKGQMRFVLCKRTLRSDKYSWFKSFSMTHRHTAVKPASLQLCGDYLERLN